MRWIGFIMMFLFYSLVTANSNGDKTSCDALDPLLGCECVLGDGFKNKCSEAKACAGRTMGWVTTPIRSSNYSVRAGDAAPNLDATEYVPGEYVTIDVRALKLNTKYIGFLLYAVDSNETKIGQWDISDAYPAPFWLPGGACEGKAIMHTDAERKNYHYAFRFKVPSSTTGIITFRCLVKQEGPNEGYFYWPNEIKDLQLVKKKIAPPSQIWYRGIPGQSCDEVCNALGYSCNLDRLQQINTPTSLIDAVSRHYSYKTPILSSCSATTPTSGGGKDGWIWYHDSSCGSDGRIEEQVTCASQSSSVIDGARLCACKLGSDSDSPTASSDSPTPSSDPLGPSASGKTTLDLPLMTMLIIITYGLTKRSGLLFFGFLFLMFNGVHGHNWLISPSRSLKASSVAPCRPRTTSVPHIQVNQGQEFQVEWATGHHQWSYVVVLASKDYEKLQKITFGTLDAYIADAPSSAHSENQIERVHVTEAQKTFSNMDRVGEPALYQEVINQGSPLYIVRANQTDAVKYLPNYLLYRYHSNFLETDVRVEYLNPKYPWIEAVYKHQHNLHRPTEWDLTKVSVPARSGPGEYIVFWKWKGYQDCIDVEVLPDTHPVTDIYGTNSEDMDFVKIDHCRFENYIRYRSGCYQVVTTPQQCKLMCTGSVANCAGVNVVPLRLPSNVFHQNQVNVDQNHINWNMCTNADEQSQKEKFAELPDNTSVCFAPYVIQEKDVNGLYTISLDPEDLIFYSTCYLKTVRRVFNNNWKSPPPPVPVLPPWSFGSECVSCSDLQLNYQLPEMLPPTWNLAEKCINCDITPGIMPTIPTAPTVTWHEVSRSTICDMAGDAEISETFKYEEHNTCESGFVCAKRLTVVGSKTILSDECQHLATQDPECSDTVMLRRQASDSPLRKFCYCWKNAECCGKCSPVLARNLWSIYELGPNDPDPNCERGMLSNGFCCPSDCTTCGSAVKHCERQSGICCANQIDTLARPCGSNAAPCVTSAYVPPLSPSSSPTSTPTPPS